ncbi:MAG: hypothetical protein HZR80_19330 [Candidatus Heimdallarchaeota archaeon]
MLINPKEAITSEDTRDNIEISSDILRKYQKAIHYKPDDYKKWVRLGFIYLQHRKLTQAADCFFQALKLDVNSCIIWNILGSIFYMQGKKALGVICVHKALNLNPRYFNAKLFLEMINNRKESKNSHMKPKLFY